MKFRILSIALAFVATALLGIQAEAASLTVNSYKLGYQVGLTLDSSARTVNTALLDLTLKDNGTTQNGYGFCVDLDTHIGRATYDALIVDPPGIAPDGRDWAAGAAIADYWAYNLGDLSVDRLAAITGVQAAIWQVIYGSALTIDSMNSDAQGVYEDVMSRRYAGTGNTIVIDLATNQDQTFTPGIPEPSAALVFGMGALMVSQAGRRRKI